MKFVKMHGLGNDFICIDIGRECVADPAALARAVSDRRVGIGSDGLILIGPSSRGDVRMVTYNVDGSRAEMCGNGLRCVAKYAVEHRLVKAAGSNARPGATPGDALGGACIGVRVETDAGIRHAECRMVDGVVTTVRVDMGRPLLDAAAIPTTLPVDRVIDHMLRVEDLWSKPGSASTTPVAHADHPFEFLITCVSMGNPHAVVFVDDLEAIAVDRVGPMIERAEVFPQRINVHFVHAGTPPQVAIRTWERGCGQTRACGSGACAVCVAGAVTGRTQRRITASLPGGELEVVWDDDDHVYMTGPAVEVFTGDWTG